MMKKIIIVLVLLLALTGCSSSQEDKKNQEKPVEKNDKLLIKTKNSNQSNKGGYLIYFMHVGERDEEPGEANQSALGPFETDINGEYLLDLNRNFNQDVGTYLNDSEKETSELEMFIVTKEDIYIRNPLNKKTIVEFVKNIDGQEYIDPDYYAKEKEIEVPFVDKYPDGVLSLTFQDATFVIKLGFIGEIPKNSYEVSIFWNDPSQPSGVGIVRVGRISRAFQYWDTPFFKTDNLSSKTGTIVINDFTTNQTVDYEGNPRTVAFDINGNPIGEKIINLKIK